MIFGGGFLVRWIVWLRWIYRQHHPRRALSVILTLCTLNNTDKRCRWKCVESFSRRCLSWSAFDRVALAESIELNSTLAALPPEAAENSNLISGDYIQRLIIYFTLIIVAFVSSGHAYSIKYTINVAISMEKSKIFWRGLHVPFLHRPWRLGHVPGNAILSAPLGTVYLSCVFIILLVYYGSQKLDQQTHNKEQTH